jgi:hypothetical protein
MVGCCMTSRRPRSPGQDQLVTRSEQRGGLRTGNTVFETAMQHRDDLGGKRVRPREFTLGLSTACLLAPRARWLVRSRLEASPTITLQG